MLCFSWINHLFNECILRYEPLMPSSFVCEPAVALVAFNDGQLEIFSKDRRCNQEMVNISNFTSFSTSGQTLDLLDDQLVLMGDSKIGTSWKYIRIHSPRDGLLTIKFSKETPPIKGSPHRHTSYSHGNKLVVLGGEQNTKGRLETNTWNELKLRWKNQTDFSGYTSAACQVKLQKNIYLHIGGVQHGIHLDQATKAVLKINIDEETVEEWPPILYKRAHHSCELLNESVILISGGLPEGVSSRNGNLSIVLDELYTLEYMHENSVKNQTTLNQGSSLHRFQHRLIRLEDTVFAVGGVMADRSRPSSVMMFNKDTTGWEKHTENLLSNNNGDVAVTHFPRSSVDCILDCQCGLSKAAHVLDEDERIVNGNVAKVNK